MKYEIGKYVIIKHSYWSIYKAIILNILEIDEECDDVIYSYGEEDKIRRRNREEFNLIQLAPLSPLMEQLI